MALTTLQFMQVLAVFHDGQQRQQVMFIGLRTHVEVSLF